MATRSHIGVKNVDGTIDFVYCHWDGYPENNGKILVNHYQDMDKVNALMKLGDLSSLGEEIGWKHDFDKWVNGQCNAYGRDRGEKNVSVTTTTFDKLLVSIKTLDGKDNLFIFKRELITIL